MLRIHTLTSASESSHYYSQGGDYYLTNEPPGYWGGKYAEMLGLRGEVQPDHFKNLLKGLDPFTGKQLTARLKSNRRPGLDLCFSTPKSIGSLYAITGDVRIPEAVIRATNNTMAFAERFISTRVRVNGQNWDRLTGNCAYAAFLHTTTRPLKWSRYRNALLGTSSLSLPTHPDPHMHIHVVMSNLTRDTIEGKTKAIQSGDVHALKPMLEAFFNAELARQFVQMGYGLEREGKWFRIAGIPKSVDKEFSRRTASITALSKRLAAELGIESLSKKGESKLGATSRLGKITGLTWEDLQGFWNARLTDKERKAIWDTYERSFHQSFDAPDRSDHYYALALTELSRKNAVVREDRVLTRAYQAGLHEVTEAGLEKAGNQFLRRMYGGHNYVTSRDILMEEKKLLDLVKAGKGRGRKLGRDTYTVKEPEKRKRKAILRILGSRDRIMSMRGVLAAHKPSIVKSITEAAELNAFSVQLTDAKRYRDHMDNPYGLLIVDKAHQLGFDDVQELVQAAEEKSMRLLLISDLQKPDRGDPVTQLEEQAGITKVDMLAISKESDTPPKPFDSKRLAKAVDYLRRIGAFFQPTREHYVEQSREIGH